MSMEFVGPYQIAKLIADENVSRVQDDATRAASITAGLEQARGEAEAAAIAAAKQFTTETVNTSHLDRDTDGTPYFRRGSMTLRVYADTDGNPFFIDS